MGGGEKKGEKKKYNIVIKGIRWKGDDIKQKTKGLHTERDESEDKRDKGYKDEAERRGGKIVAEIGSWEEKRMVMSRKKTLKRGIYVDDDLTKEETTTQKKLTERAIEERMKGNQTKVSYRKIRIGNKWFYWNDNKETIIEESGTRNL